MLTKLLLTAAVILGCYFFLRYKRGAGLARERQAQVQQVRQQTNDRPVNWLALGLVAATLIAALVFFIYDWHDSRTLLEVRVINPTSGEAVLYQVYKGDLNARSFETIQGQQVRIGNSERMEVKASR